MNHKPNNISSRLRSALMTIACAPLAAHAIDVDHADFVPPPAGTTVGLIYAQHAQRNALYANGQRVAGEPRLVSDVGIARLVHFMSVGGLTVAPQVLLPFGRLNAGRDIGVLGETSGVGDIILASPVWVINDASTQTHLGIVPYVFLPTGRYSAGRPLNLGENRWKFNLQAGLAKGLGGKWSVDLTGDVMVHGKNDDYGAAGATLKQDPLYQGQAHLRYQLAPTASAFVGLSQNWGGETRVNDVHNDDEAGQRKFSVGGSFFVGPKTQLLMSVGRDLKVKNGFKENARLNLRLLQVF